MMKKSLVMQTADSDDESDDFNAMLGKKLRKFIRLKDIDKFRLAMRFNNECESQNCRKKKTQRKCLDANNNDLDEDDLETDSDDDSEKSSTDEEMPLEQSDYSGDEIDNILKKDTGEPFQWSVIWKDISGVLESLKYTNETSVCLEHFTTILRLHVKHRFVLDMNCYRCLMHCIEPELIERIFDLELVDFDDTFHIGCLIGCDEFFAGIDIRADNITNINKHAYKVLLSLSVLIYKEKECLNQADKIIKSINNDLALFINREDNDVGRKDIVVNARLVLAVRKLLIAFALNGLFKNKKILDSFLLNSNTEITEDSETESTLDELISDSEESSDSFVGHIQQRRNQINGHAIEINNRAQAAMIQYNPRSPPLANNNLNNAGRVVHAKTVADRMNLNNGSTELNKLIFQMSLKNMCRIVIKKAMNPYCLNSVNTLKILPNTIKKFILFQDEIDEIVKLAEN